MSLKPLRIPMRDEMPLMIFAQLGWTGWFASSNFCVDSSIRFYQILECSADCILLLTLRSGELYVCIGGGPAETASTGFVIGFVGMLRLHEHEERSSFLERSGPANCGGICSNILLDFILPTQGVTTRQICLWFENSSRSAKEKGSERLGLDWLRCPNNPETGKRIAAIE